MKNELGKVMRLAYRLNEAKYAKVYINLGGNHIGVTIESGGDINLENCSYHIAFKSDDALDKVKKLIKKMESLIRTEGY